MCDTSLFQSFSHVGPNLPVRSIITSLSYTPPYHELPTEMSEFPSLDNHSVCKKILLFGPSNVLHVCLKTFSFLLMQTTDKIGKVFLTELSPLQLYSCPLRKFYKVPRPDVIHNFQVTSHLFIPLFNNFRR